MNKFTLSLGVLLTCLFFFQSPKSSHSNSTGAPAGRTGAPTAAGGTEATCAASNCHGGSLNSGPNSVTITVDGDPESLVAGQTYSVTVSIPNSTASEAGFQIVCLNPSRANCGTFTASTGNKTILGSGRTYVTHSNKNNTEWTFSWKAPATVPDSVFFYASGREESPGSRTYTTKRKFVNNITSTKSDFSSESFSLYPSFTEGRVFVKPGPGVHLFSEIRILDAKGSLVKTIPADNQEETTIDLPANAQTGKYYCQLISSAGVSVKPFFKK